MNDITFNLQLFLEHMEGRLKEQLDAVHSDVKDVVIEARKTNGRIDKLEVARDRVARRHAIENKVYWFLLTGGAGYLAIRLVGQSPFG